MLDIAFIREHADRITTAAKDKNVAVNVKALLLADSKRRELNIEVESLRATRNQLANTGKSAKPSSAQIAKGKALKTQLAAVEEKLQTIEGEYRKLLLQLPNPAHESVPIGDEQVSETIRTWGEVPKFDFEPMNHLQLGVKLELLDLETAAQISGARFYYLKNEAVLLEFALVQWLLAKLVKQGFTPVTVPQLVKESLLESTGFFPAEENEIYQVNPGEDDLFLIGTAEVPLAGLHANKIMDESELPKRYVGFSTCFRREAGSYGKDTRGIFRVHQFDKLEMFSYTHPEQSWEEHEFLLSIEEEILQELKLPYRVVNIASGDLGLSAAKKYDCEVWIPSEQRYRELTSCSNTTDFQARRGNMRFRDADGIDFVHTLNGTAMASTRTLIAILENYQTVSGSVRIPEVLQPYINKKEIE